MNKLVLFISILLVINLSNCSYMLKMNAQLRKENKGMEQFTGGVRKMNPDPPKDPIKGRNYRALGSVQDSQTGAGQQAQRALSNVQFTASSEHQNIRI